MPNRRLVDLLDAHLWSLRAEVEGQMRRMTALHRNLHSLPPAGSRDHEEAIDAVIADVSALLDANSSIRGLCVSALEEAQALKGSMDEPGSSSALP
jgi:hypothetical protein